MMTASATQLADQIKASLDQSGYRGKIVAADHIKELEDEISSCYSGGSFDELFYSEQLTFFRFQLPENLPDAKSIIVVAAPQPILSLIFTWKGKERSVFIPPTYVWSVNIEIKRTLEKVLSSDCYSLSPAKLPLKLLAMRSGLVEYGRNNISYVTGMGSFYRLSAFYTNLPCPVDDVWREPTMMKRCQKCTVCMSECPTGAICKDRFLLRAERCLTFHNENIRDFPDYIDSSMHNCLVGCMICQRVCPENRDVKDWVEERERFSEEETTQILGGTPPDELAPETRVKLVRMCLLDDMPLVRRNLGLLLT